MSAVTKVVKELTLDLSDIPRGQRKEAKEKVGNFIVNEILRDVATGRSPVEGEGKFKRLQKDYADEEHGGRRTAILELEGDMLAALKSQNKRGDKIEIGIKGSQAPKADGHNQISEEAKAWAKRTDRTQYKRRFIPDEKQVFKKRIRDGVNEILAGYKVIEEEPTETRTIRRPEVQATTPNNTSVASNDFFSDDIIESLLEDAFRLRDGL